MQPYVNPNYYSYQNPYMENQYAQNFRQNYQPMQMNNLVGRVVDSFENIAVSDIPMDGSPATFLKKDGSEVCLKAWNANGTISTTLYKPYTDTKEQSATNVSSESLESLYTDLKGFRDEVLVRLDRLDKSVSGKSNTGRGNKREVESDE